jgi:hypothetical protein
MRSDQKEQAERRAYAGSTGSMTYHSRALSHIELEGQGRHAAEAKASVTGATRVPKYPAASGPWADPVQVPDEPPLGYSVEDLEVCGTPAEVEQSLSEASSVLSPDGASPSVADVLSSIGDAPAPSALLPLAAEGVNSSGLRRGRKL